MAQSRSIFRVLTQGKMVKKALSEALVVVVREQIALVGSEANAPLSSFHIAAEPPGDGHVLCASFTLYSGLSKV